MFQGARPRASSGGFVEAIYNCRKPSIAAINGPAVGVGITLCLPMDIRIASKDAKIGFIFARRGLVPEAGRAWFLPRLVGLDQALRWCLSGRIFDANEAKEGGLVSEVTAPDQLLARAKEIAMEITRIPHLSPVAMTRADAVAILRRRVVQVLQMDGPLSVELGAGPDVKEVSPRSWKRKPNSPAKSPRTFERISGRHRAKSQLCFTLSPARDRSHRGWSCVPSRRSRSGRGRARTGCRRPSSQSHRCDRIDQLLPVSARQVAAPDRALEQNVADERDLGTFVKEHDVPRRMPGTVPHAELDIADPDRVAVFEPARRQTILGVAETRAARVAAKILQQEQIVLVRPLDRHTERAREPGCAAGMIEMAVALRGPFSRVTPCPAIACFSRSTSPPGSTTAPRLVRVHHTSEQFCW